MGLNPSLNNGTELSEEEKEGLLIASITTRRELDEQEQLNIEKAHLWLRQSRIGSSTILSVSFITKLHYRMFSDVWGWAGTFRRSDKNLGCHWREVHLNLGVLIDDTIFWVKSETYPPTELALRFKHRLVAIHCFPNGNGRHSRLMADLVMEKIFRGSPFTWQAESLARPNDIRKAYISSLRKADTGQYDSLVAFATS